MAVPGLEFAYSQAPPHMKNFVTALWGVTQALGSAIVAGVAGVDVLNAARADVFFGYAGTMVVFLVVFAQLTHGFNYVDVVAPSTGTDDDDDASQVASLLQSAG